MSGYFPNSPQNANSLAHSTNYRVYIPVLKHVIQYAQSITMPGVTLSIIEYDSRFGMTTINSANNVRLDPITINLIIDENYEVYRDLLHIMNKLVEPDSGVFRSQEFDIAIEVTNNKGLAVFTAVYTGCRIESIGSVEFTNTSNDMELTVPLTLRFDGYQIHENGKDILDRMMKENDLKADFKHS